MLQYEGGPLLDQKLHCLLAPDVIFKICPEVRDLLLPRNGLDILFSKSAIPERCRQPLVGHKWSFSPGVVDQRQVSFDVAWYTGDNRLKRSDCSNQQEILDVGIETGCLLWKYSRKYAGHIQK